VVVVVVVVVVVGDINEGTKGHGEARSCDCKSSFHHSF